MKQLLLSIIVLLMYFSSHGQLGTSFPDSFAVWREYYFNNGGPDNYFYSDKVNLMYGDTMIGGKKHKNLYWIAYRSINFKEFGQLNSVRKLENIPSSKLVAKFGTIRTEGKKVYFTSFSKNTFKNLDTAVEYLLIDFDWTEGDTIFNVSHQPGDSNYHVIKKDTVIYNVNIPIRVLLLEENIDYWDLTSTTIIVEGMGFTKSFFFRLLPTNDFNATKLRGTGFEYGVDWFCGENRQYYLDAIVDAYPGNNCAKQMQWALSSQEIKNEHPKIYPNPATNIVFIENLPQQAIITILDIALKEAGCYILSEGDNSIDVSMLTQGLYYLKIQADNGVYTQKIIKSK